MAHLFPVPTGEASPDAWRQAVVLWFVLSCFGQPAVAAPQGFAALPTKTFPVSARGRSADVPVTPYLDLARAFGSGLGDVPLYLEANLSDAIARIVVPELRESGVHDECGDRLDFSDVGVALSGSAARISASVHYQRWECVKADVPEFRGLRVTVTTKVVAKTRLVEQTAKVCLDLTPQIAREGTAVRIKAEIGCLDPSANSLLGQLDGIFDVSGALMGVAQPLLEAEIGDKLTLTLPDELKAFQPKLTDVRFADLDGEVGLVLRGSVSVTAATLGALARKYE